MSKFLCNKYQYDIWHISNGTLVKTKEMVCTRYACIVNYIIYAIVITSIIGSKAFEQLSDVMSSKHLLADIKKLSPSKQTSSLESYHGVLHHFAPKLLAFSYVGMYCR